MKLIFDNIIFSLQKAGGISVVWYELMKRVLNDSDYEIRFLEKANENIFRAMLNIPRELILKNPLDRFPLQIQRYLSPNQIDAVGIFHSSYYRIINNPRILNITTVHDFTYEYFRSGIAKTIHSMQKGRAIYNSKRVICVSESTKYDLIKFFPEYPDSQISVIHNGVNEEYIFLETKQQLRLKQLIRFDSGGYLLYVGDRKTPYKNFKLVVESAKNLKLPLVLAGGGNYAKNEKEFLESTLGSNNFVLVSGILNSDLNILYNHAICLIYPSLYEGFGIPIIEAQKAGCPVIGTNRSAIPEVAGKGAILLDEVSAFTLAEAIREVLTNRTETDNLIKEGFKNAERFSWDKCYQQTKQVYKEVYEEYF